MSVPSGVGTGTGVDAATERVTGAEAGEALAVAALKDVAISAAAVAARALRRRVGPGAMRSPSRNEERDKPGDLARNPPGARTLGPVRQGRHPRHAQTRSLAPTRTSGAPSRAASAVRSSGWCWDSRSASTRAR